MITPATAIALRPLRKRPVVDLGTAETIGRVRAVRIDPVRSVVTGIVVRGGDGGVIPIGEVQGIGQDAITVPSAATVVPDEELLPADTDAYRSRVLDEDGNDLGKLTDLHIAEDGTIQRVIIDDQAHDRPLMGIGSYAVVVGRIRAGQQPEADSATSDAPPHELPVTSEVADDGGEDLVDGAGV